MTTEMGERTALERLIEAIKGRTIDEWRNDAVMTNVIRTLGGKDEAEKRRLYHARAGLVLSGAVRMKSGKKRMDWREVMTKMMEGAAPAAKMLPVRRVAARAWIEGCVELRPWVYPGENMFAMELKECPQVFYVPPVTCPMWDRTQELVVFVPETGRHLVRTESMGGRGVIPALVPVTAELAKNVKVWKELVAASPFLGGTASAEVVQKYGMKILPAEVPKWREQKVSVANLWWHADRELAMVWFALRRGLQEGNVIEMHDGTVMVEIGKGIMAAIEVREGAEEKVTAAMELPWSLQSGAWKTEGLMREVGMWGTGVPHGVYVTGMGAAVEIKFMVSSLMGAVSRGGRKDG